MWPFYNTHRSVSVHQAFFQKQAYDPITQPTVWKHWSVYKQGKFKKYPYIHRYFVASFLYFNRTGSVYVCIHKLRE